MITQEMKATIKEARAELKKIFDYIEANRDALTEYTDLKLHDASFYEYRDMESDFPLCAEDNASRKEYTYFYSFCESSFDQFTEYLKESGIDFSKTVDYIGRTSSFYCYKDHDSDPETIINDFIYNDYSFEIINGNFSFSHFHTAAESIDDLKYFIANAFQEFQKKTADAITIFEYIEDFKKNQVEYFKEYLQFYEEILKEEKAEAEAAERADADTAHEIANHYSITADDMHTLQRVIYAY